MGTRLDAVGGGVIVPVVSGIVVADTLDYELIRPNDTTAYAVGDWVADATNGQAVIRNIASHPGGSFYITSIEVQGGNTAEVWQPKVALYQRPRATVPADNAAWTFTYLVGRQIGLLRDYTLPLLAAYGTNDRTVLTGQSDVCRCAPDSSDVYLDLITNTIFTPAALKRYVVRVSIVRLD